MSLSLRQLRPVGWSLAVVMQRVARVALTWLPLALIAVIGVALSTRASLRSAQYGKAQARGRVRASGGSGDWRVEGAHQRLVRCGHRTGRAIRGPRQQFRNLTLAQVHAHRPFPPKSGTATANTPPARPTLPRLIQIYWQAQRRQSRLWGRDVRLRPSAAYRRCSIIRLNWPTFSAMVDSLLPFRHSRLRGNDAGNPAPSVESEH
jgi:hypothetical protein